MAHVAYASVSWTSTGFSYDLQPGEAHYWALWGFGSGDAVSVSAHPVVGAPVDRILAVEDVRIQGDPSGRRLYCTVRNVGPSPVPGYAVGFGWISA